MSYTNHVDRMDRACVRVRDCVHAHTCNNNNNNNNNIPCVWPSAHSLALQEAEKVDAISHVVRRRKNQIEWLQDEERRLRLRRQAMERRIEAFREYLVRLLTHYGVKSIKGNYGSISLRDMQSVDVTDVNELPTIYKEVIVEQKPKKTLIKETLENGQAVDGARLVPRTIITIR